MNITERLAHADVDLAAVGDVVVVTGAGISAPSGLPTYRSDGSAWDDPDLERKSHASQYGNHLPQLWDHWHELRALADAASPNVAHVALADWERHLDASGGRMLVATQNVDGLHSAAGSRHVAELHGTLRRTRCMRRGCGRTWDTPNSPDVGVPYCADCGKAARPDVVLFGERLAPTLLRTVRDRIRAADLCIYVGTSGQVEPVASFADLAADRNVPTVLVNADPWPPRSHRFDVTLLGDAATLLPELVAHATSP